MNKPDRAVFTLADIRAIRYLVLVMGGVGMVMFLITDRETPLLVVAFITVVTVVPLAAIYLLRRMAARRELNEADAGPKTGDQGTKRPPMNFRAPRNWQAPRD